ncbi:MAG: hypothetical protein JXR70_10790 [Spirochaetales bacterium]|nr:hypothetical protein [Spirochaetales bacterium]
MKSRNVLIVMAVMLLTIFSCTLEEVSESQTLAAPTELTAGQTKGGAYLLDPEEGSKPDFQYLYVTYNSSIIYVYLYFYQPVTLSWGSPYVYLYDTLDNNDRDMIIFPSSTSFEIRRDKDANGHFETNVYSGSTVLSYNNGSIYRVSVPKGVFPDIGSRRIWAYSMTSKDRVPNTGYLTFSYNNSTSILDKSEGISPDHSELELGFDDTNSYMELDYHNVVSGLSWGSPYTYIYDLSIQSQRFLIAFNSTTHFNIHQDKDANGHFETLVYTGATGMALDGGKRVTITFPKALIPSLTTKKIWSYSMNSTDRIPDSGSLLF